MGLYNNPITNVDYEDAPESGTNNPLKTEPAVMAGMVMAFLYILAAFGLPISAEQQKVLQENLPVVIPGIILLVGTIRQMVVSPATHEAAVEAAFDAGMQTVAPQALPEGSN